MLIELNEGCYVRAQDVISIVPFGARNVKVSTESHTCEILPKYPGQSQKDLAYRIALLVNEALK